METPKHRWVYLDGKLRAAPSSPVGLVTRDLSTWHGKLDLLREPLRPARTGGAESMHAFASRRLGAQAARALIALFVTGAYGAESHDISKLEADHSSSLSLASGLSEVIADLASLDTAAVDRNGCANNPPG